ncbi:MAG: tripartite tricarboxylate transporter substrate binding protein BugD [Alphaproteobacteria bacterium]|nr:tripartite tricarboxylate transporter substrate binding protein BugD [Alphaproteobacteria bacterium]
MHWRVLVALLLVVTVAPAHAQQFPNKPITIVVPFPAGGPTDVVARVVGEAMRPTLGQQVLIDNVGGANGGIGVGKVVRAAPDGYTIGIGHWSTHVVNGAIYKLDYDVLDDFAPIALLATNAHFILVKKDHPAKTVTELVAWLKANPGIGTSGTAGAGSTQHIAGLFFQQKTGTTFEHIPYRGGAPAMQDLVGGRIDMMFQDPTNSLQQVQAGTIRALAFTAPQRLAVAADVPTVDEAGVPGLYFYRWHGLWAPKNTPPAVIAKLNAAVVAALADKGTQARFAELGQEMFPRERLTPEALYKYQKEEIATWWPIIKAADIKIE